MRETAERPAASPPLSKRIRYRGDVIAKAPLREQAACRCRSQQDAERDESKNGGYGKGDQSCDADKDSERQNRRLADGGWHCPPAC